MPSVPVYNMAGQVVDQLELSEAIFAAPLRQATIQQAALRQLANLRQGTHSTKTRAAVSGGGAKPWRQKGTGRARQGSTRAPQWRHGGVVFGPHPRDYHQDMPRKARRAAIRSLLTDKVTADRLRVLDRLALAEGKTKLVAEVLKALSIDGRALISMGQVDANVVRGSRNLPGVKTLPAVNMNALDLLRFDTLVLTRDGIEALERFLA